MNRLKICLISVLFTMPCLAQQVGCGGVPGATPQPYKQGCGVPSTLQPPSSGLIYLWKMNDGSGSTYAESLNANPIAVTGTAPVWGSVAGFPGSAATVSGSTSEGLAANQTAFAPDSTTPFSVSLWLNMSSFTSFDVLVTTADSTDGARGWELNANTGVIGVAVVDNFGATNYMAASFGSAISTNTLYNIVLTVDGSSKIAGVKLYLNGVAQAQTPTQDTLTATLLPQKSIGVYSRAASGGGSFNGAMGYLRIYNRVLSSSEAATIYSAGPK